MTDLLTHVLIAFAVGRLLAHHDDRMSRSYVTAVMVGALIPEMIKIKLLIPDYRMSILLGTKFSWLPLSSVYGVTLSVLIGVMLVVPTEQQRTLVALSVGAITHLILDAVVLKPAPFIELLIWPAPEIVIRVPTVDLYQSTDWWLPIVGVAIVLPIWYYTTIER